MRVSFVKLLCEYVSEVYASMKTFMRVCIKDFVRVWYYQRCMRVWTLIHASMSLSDHASFLCQLFMRVWNDYISCEYEIYGHASFGEIVACEFQRQIPCEYDLTSCEYVSSVMRLSHQHCLLRVSFLASLELRFGSCEFCITLRQGCHS